MLNLLGQSVSRTCEGTSRRNFLRVGSLGLGTAAVGLPDLLRARGEAADRSSVRDTSVIWLWLGGGPTHVETFDPKMTAPVEYRSAVGEVATSLPGVTIGGLFPKIAQASNHFSFIRSFAHTNSGHGGGTHYVMTGYDYPPADNNLPPIKPSLGSILARQRGASHPQTGIPTYVRMNGIYGDGAAWLGASHGPFDSAGEAQRNMNLQVAVDRLDDRRGLLQGLDRINREADRTGLMRGLDAFETQAFDLVLGRAKDAFDLQREDPRIRSKYGTGVGEQLLLARRLCEAGVRFVQVNYSDDSNNPAWDQHSDMPKHALHARATDVPVAGLLADLKRRGLLEDTIVWWGGEFGRTPYAQDDGTGRDHNPAGFTVWLAGGGFRAGHVHGATDDFGHHAVTDRVHMHDLHATLLAALGLDHTRLTFRHAGRDHRLTDVAGRVEERLFA